MTPVSEGALPQRPLLARRHWFAASIQNKQAAGSKHISFHSLQLLWPITSSPVVQDSH